MTSYAFYKCTRCAIVGPIVGCVVFVDGQRGTRVPPFCVATFDPSALSDCFDGTVLGAFKFLQGSNNNNEKRHDPKQANVILIIADYTTHVLV